MTTRADVNAAAGRILRDVMTHYPQCAQYIIRAAVARAKQDKTDQAQTTLRAMTREMYKDSHQGVDPVTLVDDHSFVHWMRDEPLRDDPDDPIQGVGEDDAFEAVDEVITS